MKRARSELAAIVAGLVLLPSAAFAQDDDMMSFSEDEVEEQPAAEEEVPAEDSFDIMEEPEDTGEPPDVPEEGGEGEGDYATSDADILSALGEAPAEGAAGEAAPGEEGPAISEVDETHPIWAVQQVYAKRAQRVDLQPSFALSLNDPYVQHQAIYLGASYYITEVLAVGLSFLWYRWLDATSDLNYSVSRATHQTVPINEYYWGGQIDFTYVPLYGKFAMFTEWILHWDVWVRGGGGFIYTRPIPVIDPEYRSFDFDIKFCFNVGIGGRLYLTRFLAIYLELRDYIYPEELESLVTYSDERDRADESKWLDDNYKLTNNVMLHVGVTLFLPFTFDYELPK